jgi:hypothetical protein
MKRLTPLLVLAVVGPAHAGFESMMNPMTVMNPAGTMNPMGMMNPVGMVNPLSMGAPMGLGMVNPLGMGVPVSGMGALYPALQVAPSLLTFSHMNAMTNPYLGGPFAGNPYLQQSNPLMQLGSPFMQQGYPFPQQGNPFVQQGNPVPPPALWGAPKQAAPVQQMPYSFPMMSPQPAPKPTPQTAAPVASPFPMMSSPQAAYPGPMPSLAAPKTPEPPAQGPAGTASGTAPMFFDPAVWLNMMSPGQAQPQPPAAK